jgi:ATP-binding cassette subfamily B protein
VRGVSVFADDRALLCDVHLTVPPRAIVALVGHSGAGKSTLAAVAGRLIDPDEGEVLLDGVPLKSLSRAALRSRVAYAFERPVLFGETVAEAIDSAHASLDMQRVQAAAATAGIDAFIRRLPSRYTTRLSDVHMSGGERQRLGLARAVAQAGQLLILDDATSSLDMVTESQITAALLRARPDCTQIVVAHRASTAARADLVAWLDEGRMRALEPHDVLWGDIGYRRVFGADSPGASSVAARRVGVFGEIV